MRKDLLSVKEKMVKFISETTLHRTPDYFSNPSFKKSETTPNNTEQNGNMKRNENRTRGHRPEGQRNVSESIDYKKRQEIADLCYE